jgi:hypothetical protein
MMSRVAVIEISTFRLRDGVDEQTFLAADDRVRTGFLYHQTGIVRATTARAEDGGWALIVQWYVAENADAANAQKTELDDLIDPATLERRRYTTLD